MTLQFSVKNLGKIKDANINVSPLTIVTGQNATGKSFFTKALYSIFRMIEDSSATDSIGRYATEAVRVNAEQLNKLLECIEDSESKVELSTLLFDMLIGNKEKIDEIFDISSRYRKGDEKKALEEIYLITKELIEKVDFPKNPLNTSTTSKALEGHRVLELIDNKVTIKEGQYDSSLELLRLYFLTYCSHIVLIFIESIASHLALQANFENNLKNELLDNFQVQSLTEIQSREKTSISCSGLFEVEIANNEIDATVVDNDDLTLFRHKPKSVFFESPAYWRVREALLSAKRNSEKGQLTGAPKYFFDLEYDITRKSTEEIFLSSVYDDLKNELGGEFKISTSNISFVENSNQNEISKNLVSFGMTNLGMVNALIKNNVIKKGSYVFIDEPETNLHPDWQVLMIRSLVALSKAGVNVIITTHSTEILKYIEVAFSKIKEDDGEEKVKELLSINYLDTDGTSLEFDSECPIEQTKEALLELSSPFLKLYMEGA
ncbi:ATP-binding protein [Vibrio satsumensis]|uniref:AAA family ATPase n=1 Tax=Vibrio satsumensis TaxID=2910245 RepID=UPI003D14A102